MPLKPLQYPNPGPGSFRERSIFQVPVASSSYRGRVISPDLVPFPKDVLSSTEGTVTAQSAVEAPTASEGHWSPEPLKGPRAGNGEGVQPPELAISLSRTLSRAGLEPRSPKGPDR